ncbi:MAG: ATP-binding protein [Vulcanimicrobiaceae bacterium]
MAWKFSSEHAEIALASRDDFVAALQQQAGVRVDEFVAKLIYTEVVANVVRHAPGGIFIALEADGDAHWLCVSDEGPPFEWRPSLPTDPYTERGRGLFLIDRYADTVFVERLPAKGNVVRIRFKNLEATL